MKIKRILKTILLSIFIISLSTTSILVSASEKPAKLDKKLAKLWPKAPSVNADSAILMDLSTGLILYEKNSRKEQYPASITKIMTTLLAIENCSLGEIVTFSHDAIFGIEAGSSHIAIDVGEKLTMEQCLYAIMLASANEVSWGVGEHISGSISAFSALMNKRAKELGCENTNFVNANGLHDDKHHTSAYDMAMIARKAMSYPIFRKVTSTKRYTIPPTNKNKEDNIFLNHHQMLNAYSYPQYEYEYCIGGKTGYTSKAGSTLVTFAKKDGIELVCVVMRAQGPTSPKNEYTDTTSLFDFGFENYKKYDLNQDTLAVEDSPLFTMYSPFFDAQASPLKLGDNACILLPNRAKFEEAKQNIDFYDDIAIQNGENSIGKISYTYGGKTVGSIDIIYEKKDVPVLTLAQKTKEVTNQQVTASNRFNLKPFIIFALLAVLGIILWIYIYFRQKKKRDSKKFDLRL